MRSTLFAALTLLVACEGAEPVRWGDEQVARGSSGGGLLSRSGQLATDSSGVVASRITPPAPLCPGSLRVAAASGTLYAVWWSPRADSSATLVSAASSDEGKSWGTVSPVDTTDRSADGCKRSAPAIAADSSSGYVYVSYGLTGAEGPGVFFSHSMDRGTMFHSPVPIVYGEHPGATSVAGSGDIVAVAYEDPNSRSPRVGLALSRSSGHIFEQRIAVISGDNGSATTPLVALDGHRIFAGWLERVSAGTESVFRIRSGTLP